MSETGAKSMRLITIEREADLGALADRLYPDLTPQTRELVGAALLKANPGLARSDAFRPGLVVRVPEIPELRLKPSASGKDPAGELLGTLKEAIAGYRAQLANSFTTAEDEVNKQEELLKQRDVAAAIGVAPSAAQLAKILATTLAERRKSVADGKTRVELAFD